MTTDRTPFPETMTPEECRAWLDEHVISGRELMAKDFGPHEEWFPSLIGVGNPLYVSEDS